MDNNKSWFRRHPIWTGVIIIVSIAIIKSAIWPAGQSQNDSMKRITLIANVKYLLGTVIIDNQNDFTWWNVRIKINSGTLNDGYYEDVKMIQKGEEYIAGLSDFANEDGERFNPRSMKIRKLIIKGETPEGEKLFGAWEFK